MKTKHYLLLFSFVFYCVGCNQDKTEEETNDDPIHGIWNMINVSGGFSGIANDFDKGEIIWEFDAVNSTLEVKNVSSSLFSGLSSGNYSYSMVEADDGGLYFYVGAFEMGAITIAKSEMIINQNDMSMGTGADRFVFKLVR